MYAYVFLVMKGDSYAAGAVAAAESIRITNTPHDIVCMVTPDVSEQARAALQTCCKVVEVPYIAYASKPMKTHRQMQLYGSWLSESYTKWNLLRFTQYRKVLFVDADIIVVKNIDHLFELAAPAATFSTPWASEYATPGLFSIAEYPRLHGATVPWRTIHATLQRGNGYTFIASMVLLEPSLHDHQQLVDMLQLAQPFGYDSWSTPDEQSLAAYYKRDWTHIHQKYNFIVHKVEWLKEAHGASIPHVLHYFSSKKPWLMTTNPHHSPWNTDRVWWHVLCLWSKRTGITLPLPMFAHRHGLRIKYTTLDDRYFPWLPALQHKFPVLFGIKK